VAPQVERAGEWPPSLAHSLTAILGGTESIVEELTSPWTLGTRSVRVAAGVPWRDYMVQWTESARTRDRRAMARRVRLGRDLARRAPWLPLPEVVGGDGGGPVPFLVTRFVNGTPGRELLGDDANAARLGAAAGRVQREMARVPTAGLRLSRTWSDPDLLEPAARRWLAGAGADLDQGEAGRVREAIERVPGAFVGFRPTFAHGDLAPVNVLMRDGAVVALLDLERARLAHPLFDAAWWRWVLRYHHASICPTAVDSFLSAAGVDRGEATPASLDVLAILQCLEVLSAIPASRQGARREWARRIVRILDWSCAPHGQAHDQI
jgi:Ser/Thr protein kinase RdoA (MazF antagonist)